MLRTAFASGDHFRHAIMVGSYAPYECYEPRMTFTGHIAYFRRENSLMKIATKNFATGKDASRHALDMLENFFQVKA
jgi:hypothetical protein